MLQLLKFLSVFIAVVVSSNVPFHSCTLWPPIRAFLKTQSLWVPVQCIATLVTLMMSFCTYVKHTIPCFALGFCFFFCCLKVFVAALYLDIFTFLHTLLAKEVWGSSYTFKNLKRILLQWLRMLLAEKHWEWLGSLHQYYSNTTFDCSLITQGHHSG